MSQASSCLTAFDALEWVAGKGVDPSHDQHAAYLQRFAEQALARLLNSTDHARARQVVRRHVVMAETVFHLKFAMQRAITFAHSAQTRRVTEPLDRCLSNTKAIQVNHDPA